MSFGAAVVSRWNNKSLNSTIAALFPTSGNPDQVIDHESKTAIGQSGSPTEQALPRCRLFIPDSIRCGLTAGCKTWRQSAFVYVFCGTRVIAVTHRNSIVAAFDNCRPLQPRYLPSAA